MTFNLIQGSWRVLAGFMGPKGSKYLPIRYLLKIMSAIPYIEILNTSYLETLDTYRVADQSTVWDSTYPICWACVCVFFVVIRRRVLCRRCMDVTCLELLADCYHRTPRCGNCLCFVQAAQGIGTLLCNLAGLQARGDA